MDREIKRISDLFSNLCGTVAKLEAEEVLRESSNDISVTEIHTLTAIGTGRPRTMTHVANILDISVSTLTTSVNRLVKKGYVERLRDENDRRIVKIHLTERGTLAVKAHDDFLERLISGAMAQIPQENREVLMSAMDNIDNFLTDMSSMAYVRSDEFRLEPIRLGEHVLPIPIVQAAMSIGVAGSRLASAVAIEGGLGLVGTTEIGYRHPQYREKPLTVNLETVETEIRLARETVEKAGGKGLIGAGIMWSNPHAGEYVKAAVKGGAQVIVTSAGIPKELPRYCSDRKVALVPTISSKRVASAITKTWTQKYNRTPDGFIFQGPFAAGLLGFKESELEVAQSDRYRTISQIKAELSKMENCPLIAGGGVYTKKDAEMVYRYGADGILMGTRFVTTEECDASDEYKKLYLNCTADDVTIIRSPMKTLARVMRNTFADSLCESGREDYDIIGAVKRGVEGDYDGGLVFCSANADRIDKIDTVADVFWEFTSS